MIKKIPIKTLRPGMYIHDLNCGWMEHPFATKRFKVDSDKVVEKVRQIGVREVFIDTARGLDVDAALAAVDAAAS